MILIKVIDLYEWQPLSKSERIKPLTDTLSPRQLRKLHREFAEWILIYFQALVKQSIKTQRISKKRPFKKLYQGLSPAYKKMKKKNKLMPGFWQATGFLGDFLEVWKEGRTWNIGFRDHVKHPSNGTPVHIILKSLEEGVKASNIPARPLFYPIARSISKSMFFFLNKFLKKAHPRYYLRLNRTNS